MSYASTEETNKMKQQVGTTRIPDWLSTAAGGEKEKANIFMSSCDAQRYLCRYHNSTLYHRLAFPLPTIPIILIVSLPSGEVGAVCVGVTYGLGIGDCRRQERRRNVPWMCHVVGIPHPCQHGWHGGQQPRRCQSLTMKCCSNQPKDTIQVANFSWQLLLPSRAPGESMGQVGVGLVGEVVRRNHLLLLRLFATHKSETWQLEELLVATSVTWDHIVVCVQLFLWATRKQMAPGYQPSVM